MKQLFKICWPWGAGLGTLGVHIGNYYSDIHVKNWRVYRFVAHTSPVEADRTYITQRSWYRLDIDGWKLLKREDRWGCWKAGKRQPPLMDMPDNTLARAFKLRDAFRPFQIIDWYGKTMEVFSFPFPNKASMGLMLREPNDPTTLQEVVLEEYV